MKLLFLGTGAPDWQKARGFVRHNTSLLVNDDLLIDPGPDVPAQMAAFGAELSRVKYILVSHTHNDHYVPETVALFPRAAVYGSVDLQSLPVCPENFRLASPGSPLLVGSYAVLPVTANHYGVHAALHFAIRDAAGKSLFYGHDGVWYTSDTFAYLCRTCRQDGAFSCMLFDATVNGWGSDGRTSFFDRFEQDEVSKLELTGHNNAAMAIALRDVCRDAGVADANTVCVCNHLAWHGYPDMETARRVFEPKGFTVPYDGFVLEV